MEGALAWVGQIAEWFGQFVPRIRNVRITSRGVKHKRGRVVIVDPGLTVYWPIVTDYYDYPIARQGEELREQTIVTTDGKTTVVGGMMIYEVPDLYTLMSTCYSATMTTRELALTAVHDVCCQMSWEELREAQRKGTLDTKLKNEAQKTLQSYGIKVIKFMLTDLAPCRVIRLVQTSSKNGD